MNYPYTGYPIYQQQQYPSYQDRLTQLQNQYQQALPQQNQNNGLLWVQGMEGAKSYLVAPNTTVLLMDADAQKFYLKSTDGSGMPNLRVFEYKEVSPNTLQAVQSDSGNLDDKYVTRTEYDALKQLYADMEKKLEQLHNSKPSKSKVVSDNE